MQDSFSLDPVRHGLVPAASFRMGRLEIQSKLVLLIAAQDGIGVPRFPA